MIFQFLEGEYLGAPGRYLGTMWGIVPPMNRDRLPPVATDQASAATALMVGQDPVLRAWREQTPINCFGRSSRVKHELPAQGDRGLTLPFAGTLR